MYGQISRDVPVVQKYGGTSMGTPERIRSIARRICGQYQAGWTRLAIVVSAMSGETNRLIQLVQQVNPDAPPMAYDMAVASGEQVAVALLTAALAAEGVDAEPFLSHQLGIMTDEFHSRARIRSIDVSKIESCWNRSAVAVVAGFQGVTIDRRITTLGRGGSDTSAVALAIALKSGFCEINTDVDGVFTCDPRVVSSAKLIENMDFEVALEMASLGSKVLHPRCVELGAKYQMPVVVRNTFTGNDHRRTRVMNTVNLSKNTPEDYLEAPVVSGVTLDRDVAKITLLGLPIDTALITKIFVAVAEAGVNVDIIVHNLPDPSGKIMHLGFTTSKGDVDKSLLAIRSVWTPDSSLTESSAPSCKVETDCAKVSVVGVGMRSHAGVAARAFEALSRADINIKMISTSEIKISCVIGTEYAEEACRVLHNAFISEIA